MDKNLIVSIIMPAYNSENYISGAIESLLTQTFQDFEIIVINDCSTDKTVEKISSFTDKRIKILHTTQNAGAAEARNLGLQYVQGKYIAFLDADDYAYPTRLEEQVNFLEKNTAIDLVGTWTEVVDEKGNVINTFCLSLPNNHLPIKLLFQNCFALSSVMMRNHFEKVSFDGSYAPAEDYEFWTKLVGRANFAILPKILIRYLEHSQGISKVKEDKMRQNVKRIITQQVLKLEIEMSESEYELHQQIAHLEFRASKEFLFAVDAWLQKLLSANQKAKIYEEKSFALVLAEYWLKICFAHARLGFTTLSYFFKSPLSQWLSIKYQFKLFFLCLKNLFN
jgi:glycosyltransferase involved in cell wall biosynthesis